MNIDISTLSEDEKKELFKALKTDLAESAKETIERFFRYKELSKDLSIKNYNYVRDDNMADYAGDCVMKSISSILGLDYKFVFEELFRIALSKYLLPNDTLRVIAPFLDNYGWKNLTVFAKDNMKDLGEIIYKYPDKELILGMYVPRGGTGHMLGYKDKTIYDYTSKKLDTKTDILLHLEFNIRFFFMKSDL